MSNLTVFETIHIILHFVTIAMWGYALILMYLYQSTIKNWIAVLVYIAGIICIVNLTWQATVSELHLQKLPTWLIYNAIVSYIMINIIKYKSIKRPDPVT